MQYMYDMYYNFCKLQLAGYQLVVYTLVAFDADTRVFIQQEVTNMQLVSFSEKLESSIYHFSIHVWTFYQANSFSDESKVSCFNLTF